jgi:hypothetical protein
MCRTPATSPGADVPILANDATTGHSCRYAFRVCSVYARDMAAINALR